MNRRPTRAERDRERRRRWEESEQRVWADFQPKLDALQSRNEAIALTHQAPPPDAPGRQYYSNLMTFLGNGYPPLDGMNAVERRCYLQLIDRMTANGELTPKQQAEIRASFQWHAERERG
jgi:hypothetical protein